ncbi:MAG: DUF819 family protein, partial [Gemmatimonadota bacterium]
MTHDSLYVLAALCALVVATEYLVRRTFFRHFGTALLVILVTAVVANLGWIPAGSSAEAPVPVYDAIFAYLAPLAIFWLVLPISLREVLKAGLPIIALFLIGSVGVMVGTYIGGSINFNAVALGYDVVRDGTLFAGTVVVDNILTAVWMMATLALPRLVLPLWRTREGSQPAADPDYDVTGVAEDTETVHPLDLAILLGLGFAALYLSNYASAALADAGWNVPSILILTALALALAQFPVFATLRGTRVLGMFAVYLFLAVIGAFCDVVRLVGLGRTGLLLLGFATTLVAVHGLFTFAGARLLRIDPETAAVASQANIGGGTSALAVA